MGRGELGRGLIVGYANLGYQGFIVPGKKLCNFPLFTFYYFFIVLCPGDLAKNFWEAGKALYSDPLSCAGVNLKMKVPKVILHFLPWQSAKSFECF